MTTRTNADYAATLLRVSTGVLFLSHGLMKVLTFTIPGTVAFFGSIGFPPAVAYLTMFGEVAGGIALLLGILPRLVSVLTLPILLGALYVHSGNGWTFSNEGGGWEFVAFWIVAQVSVIILGAGAFAVKLPFLSRTYSRTANA